MKKSFIKILLLTSSMLCFSSLIFAQTKSAASARKATSKLPQTIEEAISSGSPVIEKLPNGNINWTQQYFEAQGQSVLDTVRFKNPAQARAMATRGAVVVAQRNLLEIIKGVSIVGETTVEDMITTSDKISSKVEGVIKGATQVGDATLKDGLVTVTMRVPIYAPTGIAPVVIESAQAITDSIKTAQAAADSIRTAQTAGTADTIRSGTQVSPPPAANDTKRVVFNLNGKPVDPTMFPVVVDQQGKILADFTKLYDPKKGEFPKYVELAKNVMTSLGVKKGTQIIDVIQNGKGELVVSDKVKAKVNWDKIINVVGKIGKLAMLFI